MNDHETGSSSTAKMPDLDWSQVRETVRMLQLAVGQIQVAMHEGDGSIDTLTDMFTSMVENVSQIQAAAADMDHVECQQVQNQVQSNCSAVNEKIHSAIVAFQFYDRLNQRLGHVVDSLSSLAVLVADQNRLYSPREWSALQQKIRSRYNMQEELEMFDAVLAGMEIQKAIHICLDKVSKRQQQEDDDIELF